MKKNLLITFLFLLIAKLHAQSIISENKEAGAFPIVSATQTASIVFDDKDDSLIQKAAQLFQKDVEMVSGTKANISSSVSSAKNIIVIGSINKSMIIQ